MIQSQLFLLRDNNFIHAALSDLKRCRMFSFTYTLHERSFSKIHNRVTLKMFYGCLHIFTLLLFLDAILVSQIKTFKSM